MNMDLQKIIELLKAQMPNATDIPGGVALDLSLLAGEIKMVLAGHYVVFLTRKKR